MNEDLFESGCLSAAESTYVAQYMLKRTQSLSDEAFKCEVLERVFVEFKALPVSLMEVVNLAQRQTTSIDELARVAQEDPSLVAQIMKLVNSSLYSLPKAVTDFKLAVSLLGFAEMSRLAMQAALYRAMPELAGLEEIQSHCLAVSRNAYDLGRVAKVDSLPLVSLAAMLHGVGDVLIGLLQAVNKKIGPLFAALDRPQVGARLLEHWRFPEEMVTLVRLQEAPAFCRPEDLPEEHASGLILLHLAELCDQYLAGKDEDEIGTGLVARHLAFLKMPQSSITELVQEILLPSLAKKRYKVKSPLLAQ